MSLYRAIRNLFCVISAALMLLAPAYASTKKSARKSSTKELQTTSKKGKHARRHRRSRRFSWRNSQRKPDEGRTREIQEALIREKYLRGEPSGVWDQKTLNAMSRYQREHGWQSKSVPDARALIELGLGPKNDNLLNPESAMTSRPQSNSGPAADRDVLPAVGVLPQ